MDTSETYIKMCEKAVEIQEADKHKDGDFISGEVTGKGYFSGVRINERGSRGIQYLYNKYGYFAFEPEVSFIWLPRQDQLQKILRDIDDDLGLLELFFNYCREDGSLPNTIDSGCDTFEKMWLAFVMKEKFNKSWDGTDWR